ncbi:amino acid permease [uncultured Shimia sp.]|uniref:APC family permease n=1 Tax=uncultured Shimia sp. TaxID=573152 RepID=UPI002616202B|nr:amino acid permease [uncultured Shimia sp.]
MAEHLKRNVGFGLLTSYGVGVMIGAGIYVLVGAVAGQAGSWAWLAFVLAGLIALPSALSFAELSSRVPEAGGAAAYMRAAFEAPWLAALVGLAMVLAGTISAAAVLRGGVGYLTGIVQIDTPVAIIALGLILTGIAIWGVVESLSFAALLTVIEVVGLILVIGAGFLAAPAAPTTEAIAAAGDINAVLYGVLAASALAFFAFVGFEDIVNLAEETRDPERTMPRAIIAALVLVSLIYALVAFAATRAVPPAILAQSDRPLVLVWQAYSTTPAVFLSAIAVAAALNGVLAQIVMAARVLFGLGRQGGLFAVFHHVHPRLGTPVLGSLGVGVAVILCALWLPVATLAEVSATVLLMVFVLVNAALLRMKLKSDVSPAFQVPRAVPVLGMLASLTALAVALGDFA